MARKGRFISTFQEYQSNLPFKIERIFERQCKSADGKLKTYIESISSEPTQCKARKSMISQILWDSVWGIFDEVVEAVEVYYDRAKQLGIDIGRVDDIYKSERW